MAIPSDEELIREAMAHARRLYDLATAAERDRHFNDAERYLRERLRVLPDDAVAKYALSQLLLARGEYKEGFQLYEARSELPQFAKDVTRPTSRGRAAQ